MKLPKKNQLKAASEKMEYLKKLLDLNAITQIEYDSYIFLVRDSIYLDPEKKTFIENRGRYEEKYMGKGSIKIP